MVRDWPCAALWPPLSHSLREPALFRLSPAGRTPVSGVFHPDTSVTKNQTPVWVFDFLWRMGRDCNSHSLTFVGPFRLRYASSRTQQLSLQRLIPSHHFNTIKKCPAGTFFYCGGWGGIRTPGSLATSAVFKTVAFDRSATHPKLSSFDGS